MNDKFLIPILNKHSINRSEILKIGNKILENNLIIKYNYIPKNIDSNDKRLNYSDENFNWELDFNEETNMAMLHLHSLEPISYLLLAYNENDDIKYLNKAYELLFDWYKHAESTEHFYLWYRHCAADRAIVISQLYQLKNHIELTSDKISIIYNLIFSHKHYLCSMDNFVIHNHGLLMDIGLISLSLVTGDKASFEFSFNRVQYNFCETFTENMICVENSISYSIYNLEQFIKCQKYLLMPIEYTIDEKFDKKINLALNFLSYIIQPNHKFPNLGDGEQLDIEYLKTLSIYEYYPKHNIFNLKQDETFMKVYTNEGYAIFKGVNSYLLLNAGDLRKNHKHADDLSFILFYDEEIFIDPGISSYNIGEIREYQTSASAHNTIVLNNENYDYINNNKKDIAIVLYKELEDYYYVVMKNNSYSYASIARHFFILKTDFTIVIYDEIISRTRVLASQFYNLSPKLSKKLSLKIDQSKIVINDKLLMQTDDNSYFEYYNGKNPYKTNAIYSEKFHDIQPIIKLSINKYNTNPALVTLISRNIDSSIKLSSEEESVINVFINENVIKLKKEKINLNISENLDGYINIKRNGNRIKGETIADLYEKQEYAWDIMKGQEKEKLIWYQKSNEFEYTFDKEGTYSIRCYIRNENNIDDKSSFISQQKIII